MINEIYSHPDSQIVATGNDKIITALRFDAEMVYEVTQNFETFTHELSNYTIDILINDFIN